MYLAAVHCNGIVYVCCALHYLVSGDSQIVLCKSTFKFWPTFAQYKFTVYHEFFLATY